MTIYKKSPTILLLTSRQSGWSVQAWITSIFSSIRVLPTSVSLASIAYQFIITLHFIDNNNQIIVNLTSNFDH